MFNTNKMIGTMQELILQVRELEAAKAAAEAELKKTKDNEYQSHYWKTMVNKVEEEMRKACPGIVTWGTALPQQVGSLVAEVERLRQQVASSGGSAPGGSSPPSAEKLAAQAAELLELDAAEKRKRVEETGEMVRKNLARILVEEDARKMSVWLDPRNLAEHRVAVMAELSQWGLVGTAGHDTVVVDEAEVKEWLKKMSPYLRTKKK